jgi:hypothetical protein
MKKFMVLVESTFNNYMFIDAENEHQAREIAENGTQDFFQKHMGERALNVKEILDETEEEWIERIREKGFF